MIITIDTTKDSQEDIRRAISLLKQIAGDNSPSYSSPSSDFIVSSASSTQQMQPPSAASDGFAAMFGDMQTMNSAPLTQAAANPQPTIIGLPQSSSELPKKRVNYDFETY